MLNIILDVYIVGFFISALMFSLGAGMSEKNISVFSVFFAILFASALWFISIPFAFISYSKIKG